MYILPVEFLGGVAPRPTFPIAHQLFEGGTRVRIPCGESGGGVQVPLEKEHPSLQVNICVDVSNGAEESIAERCVRCSGYWEICVDESDWCVRVGR